jgi:hypothetical protein
MHEDGRIAGQYGECVCDQLRRVVSFAAVEIPIVANPRQRFGRANVEGVADERWSGDGDSSHREQQGEQGGDETEIVKRMSSHVSTLLAEMLGAMQEDERKAGSVNELFFSVLEC